MPPEPAGFDAQRALAAYIRDPDANAPPAGIDPRRARLYADLFFDNVRGLLAQTFPVVSATLGADAWRALVRGFLRTHPARTPVFAELPREFLHYLDARAPQADDPPWLHELAHYEWIELALQTSTENAAALRADRDGDLRTGVPLLSPLAWPLAYDWPVHRIGPDAVPHAPSPTLLLVHRRDDGTIAFHELAPLAWHLLQRLTTNGSATGAELLAALAHEAGAEDVDAFVDQGLALLERYRSEGIVAGTRPCA